MRGVLAQRELRAAAEQVEELADNGIFGTLSSTLSEGLSRCFTGEFAKRMQVREEEYLNQEDTLLGLYIIPRSILVITKYLR